MMPKRYIPVLLLASLLWIAGCSPLPEVPLDGRTFLYNRAEYNLHPQLEVKEEATGKAVAETDSGDAIQTIKGLPQDRWLAIRNGHTNRCSVYTEKSIGEISLEEFAPTKMILLEYTPEEKKLATIRDEGKIGRLVRVMSEQPPAKLPEKLKPAHVQYIHLTSDKYQPVVYVLRYETYPGGKRYLIGKKVVELDENFPDILQ
ncbi:hypothetical protein CLV97_13215 [Planifilum fimeticola]|uniref:Uncharacterized protein n=2 Tax=Planifilum fimeticola TaxID=201975 RepID=A0A2T0LAU7_9BACL|nr:hypothetical protein CLV97_13215 [Planifilum fimeticola]